MGNGRSIKPGVAQNAIVNRSILQEKITKKVTEFTEELVAELVKKYGISLPDNTLLQIYNHSERYATCLADTVVSGQVNDIDFNYIKQGPKNIYLP